MINYAEAYEIAGDTYGIEDYEEPGEHFMPERKQGRFHCWKGGGGIGYADTLEKARAVLRSCLTATLQERLATAEHLLAETREALSVMEEVLQ